MFRYSYPNMGINQSDFANESRYLIIYHQHQAFSVYITITVAFQVKVPSLLLFVIRRAFSNKNKYLSVFVPYKRKVSCGREKCDNTN